MSKTQEQAALMGCRVVVTKLLQRKTERLNDRWGSPDRKTWIPVDTKAEEGWIVGFRSLGNGIRDYETDVGFIWTPDGPATPAVLVAFGPRSRAIPVPVDGFTVVERALDESEVRG